MPRITTKSGRTLDDVLNDECHDRDSLTATAHAFPGESIATIDYTTTDGVRHIEDVSLIRLTRRGDSIVPPPPAYIRNTIEAPPEAEASRRYRYTTTDGFLSDGRPIPASHATDPHTSAQAARSVAQAAQHHRVAILTALRLFGPATGHELAARLRLEYVQVAKRLTELAADGRINRRETGTRGAKPLYQTRNSPTGRPACVWHLNPLAESA